jgi:hypothetical protein
MGDRFASSSVECDEIGWRGPSVKANVSEESTKAASYSQAGDTFGVGFEEMYYGIVTDRDSFDLDRFLRYFGSDVANLDAYGVAAAPRDGSAGQYHVHCTWFIDGDKIEFRVEYYSGAMPHASDEREPYAEQFMEWLGQFFKKESVSCHIHARFEYPLAERLSTFPLPLATDLSPAADITGISLRLKDSPNGVSSVRLTRSDTLWYTEVVAHRTAVFSAFEPYSHAHALESILAMFLKEAEP